MLVLLYKPPRRNAENSQMSLDSIQLLTNLRSRTLFIKDMSCAMSLRREVILVLLESLDAVIRIRLDYTY